MSCNASAARMLIVDGGCVCQNNGVGNLYGDFVMWFLLACGSGRRLQLDWTGVNRPTTAHFSTRGCTSSTPPACTHTKVRFDLSRFFVTGDGWSWRWRRPAAFEAPELDVRNPVDCRALAEFVSQPAPAVKINLHETHGLFPRCDGSATQADMLSRFYDRVDDPPRGWDAIVARQNRHAVAALNYYMHPTPELLHYTRQRVGAAPFVALHARTGWGDEAHEHRHERSDGMLPRRDAWRPLFHSECHRRPSPDAHACPFSSLTRASSGNTAFAASFDCAQIAAERFTGDRKNVVILSDAPGLIRAVLMRYPTRNALETPKGRRLHDLERSMHPPHTNLSLASDMLVMRLANVTVAASMSTLTNWASRPHRIGRGNKVVPVCHWRCRAACPCDGSIAAVSNMADADCRRLRSETFV